MHQGYAIDVDSRQFALLLLSCSSAPMLRNYIASVSKFASVCVFVFGGIACKPAGDDGWSDFQGGGLFDSPSPSMSRDGEWITFASPRTGHGDIYRIRRDGTSRTRLTDDDCFECAPLYGADDEQIIFAREEAGARHIWIMRDDGSSQRQLTFGTGSDEPHEVSVDGKWLILPRTRAAGGLGRSSETIAIDIDGEGNNEIPLGYMASFSPDGTQIVFSPNDQEIWLLDLATMSRKKLATGSLARFFPDGRQIEFLANPAKSFRTGTWRSISLDDRRVTFVARGTDCLLTPDGQSAVCFSPDHRFELFRSTIGKGDAQAIESPVGYKTWLRPCVGGFLFTLIGQDRVGEICLLSTKRWSVTRVATIR